MRSEFENYNYFSKRAEELKLKIQMAEYKMSNLHSPSLEGIAIHQSSQAKSDSWYRASKEKEIYTEELALCRISMRKVEEMLQQLNRTERNILKDVFIKKMDMRRIANKYHYTYNAMYNKVGKIIDRLSRDEDIKAE